MVNNKFVVILYREVFIFYLSNCLLAGVCFNHFVYLQKLR